MVTRVKKKLKLQEQVGMAVPKSETRVTEIFSEKVQPIQVTEFLFEKLQECTLSENIPATRLNTFLALPSLLALVIFIFFQGTDTLRRKKNRLKSPHS